MSIPRCPGITIIGALLLAGCAVTETPLPAGHPCEDPRPQVCTMNYEPVCGYTAEGTAETFSNSCSACSNPQVVVYQGDKCAAED